jgi:ATP-dependent phosphoenolpyruvate carboxykinase
MPFFLSGYTAKVAGTEIGVTEPQATFSTRFARRSATGARRLRPDAR